MTNPYDFMVNAILEEIIGVEKIKRCVILLIWKDPNNEYQTTSIDSFLVQPSGQRLTH